MKKAQLTLGQRLYFFTGRLFFAFMSTLGALLTYHGARSHDEFAALVGIISTAFFLDCLKGYLRFPRPANYGLDQRSLVIGKTSLPLVQIQSGRVVRIKPCALAPEAYRPPALELKLENQTTLTLPLVPKGWDEVYDGLRQARPDLGLPPWPKVPVILEALAPQYWRRPSPRGKDHLPKTPHRRPFCLIGRHDRERRGCPKPTARWSRGSGRAPRARRLRRGGRKSARSS